MDEAIDLAIEGRSPYPDRAAFIDADTASAGHEIKRAADDGSTCVLTPEAATRCASSWNRSHSRPLEGPHR